MSGEIADRLASLRERAGILGIDIEDVMDDPDAIERRISSYRTASNSNVARRGGFNKTATSIGAPHRVEVIPPE